MLNLSASKIGFTSCVITLVKKKYDVIINNKVERKLQHNESRIKKKTIQGSDWLRTSK
jgi:hypothetical protein